MAEKLSHLYRRWGGVLLLAAFASLVVVMPAAQKELADIHTNVPDWLPADDQATEDLRWFVERFGAAEILAISWPGCSVDDPRLEQLANRLITTRPGSTSSDSAGPPFFMQAFSGPAFLDYLMSEPIEFSREAAIDRLRGWLVGPDGKTTSVVARLVSAAGAQDRAGAVEAAYVAAEEIAGIDRSEIRLGGPTVDSVAIDYAMNNSLGPMIVASVFVCLAIAWYNLRSWILIAVVFLIAEFNQQMTLAIMYWTGQHMDAVLMMVPTLVFVLSVAASIHIVHYYFDAVKESGWETATGTAVIKSATPCILANLTTAAGMLSLVTGKLAPIKQFGKYSAGALTLTLMLFYLLIPSALALAEKPLRRWYERRHAAEGRQRVQAWWLRSVMEFTIRFHWPVIATFTVAMVVLGTLATRIETSVNLDSLFPSSSRVVQDYAWLEENLGGLIPVEIVVRFPTPEYGDRADATFINRLKLVEELEQKIRGIPDIGATVSAASFAPQPPEGGGARGVAIRRTMNRRLLAHRPELVRSNYFVEDRPGAAALLGGAGILGAAGMTGAVAGEAAAGLALPVEEELWRITARVPALQQVDFDVVMANLNRVTDETLAGRQRDFVGPGGTPTPIRSVVCGGMALVHSAQDQLLIDLWSSFTSAFWWIALMMMMVLWRNLAAALRALLRGDFVHFVSGALALMASTLIVMVPNLFPVFLVFGVMGALGTKVDVGAMMTASIALGIAVDDTLHYLTWFQRRLNQGYGRMSAVMHAYRTCGAAMTEASIVVGLGMLVFVLSDFVPISRFGVLTASCLISAIAGDLILLPATLVSPLGRVFMTRK